MPQSNLNNDHFTDVDKELINKAWETIRRVMSKKARNLSPEERKTYGSISEENKLVVMKVLDYEGTHPHLKAPEVNYEELKADWADRNFLAGFVSQMIEMMNIVNNIRITHDYDAFQNSRVDYNYTKYKMETEPGAGFETKYKDLLYFFKTNTNGPDSDGEAPTDPA